MFSFQRDNLGVDEPTQFRGKDDSRHVRVSSDKYFLFLKRFIYCFVLSRIFEKLYIFFWLKLINAKHNVVMIYVRCVLRRYTFSFERNTIFTTLQQNSYGEALFQGLLCSTEHTSAIIGCLYRSSTDYLTL